MRRIVFGGASSLDSYFARPDHSVDWLRWSDDVAEITASFWKTIDTVIMGRKTFEVAEQSGQIDLELKESRVLANGCVYVMYRVVR